MRKILSAILTLCMVISMLPAAFAADETDTSAVTYTYNFLLSNWDNQTSIKDEVDYTDTNDTWAWDSSNINTVRTHHKLGIEANASNEGDYFALKIKIPTAGTYSVNFVHGQSTTHAGYGSVYFLPAVADVESALTTASPIGENIEYYVSSGAKSQSVPLSDIVVNDGEEGEYLIVFVATKEGASSFRMYPTSLTLKRVGDASVDTGYTFNYDLNPVGYGGNANTNQQSVDAVYDDYSDTYGMWKWGGKSFAGNVKTYQFTKQWTGSEVESCSAIYGIVIASQAVGDWAAIKIATPVLGDYDAKLTYGKHMSSSARNGGKGNVYLLPGSVKIEDALENAKALNNEKIDYCNEGTTGAYGNNVYEFENKATVTEEESWLVFKVEEAGVGEKFQMFPQSITLTNGGNEYFMYAAASASDVEIGSSTAIGITAHMSDGTTANTEEVILSGWQSSDEKIAKVNENGVVTGISAGTATITCTAAVGEVEQEAKAAVRVTGAEIAADATEKTVSLSVTTNVPGYKVKVDGTEPESDIYVDAVAVGTTVTLEAPEISGYKLVGWKRGTAEDTDTKYITLTDDNTYTVWTGTYLTAVYDEVTPADEKSVEFWDQNGAYIGKMDEETYNSKKENLFTPSLVGYQFINWFVDKTTKLTDLAELPYGVTRAVAQYNAKAASNITHNGNTVADATEYNKKIPLTSTTAKYWMRDGKIVDYGNSYNYFVWDATDITEGTDEIADKVPLVILEYSENHNAYMIEYDKGDYEIVEAGILFADTGSTPTIDSKTDIFTSQKASEHGQFTVPAIEGKTARGYIIYKDSDNSLNVIYADAEVAE